MSSSLLTKSWPIASVAVAVGFALVTVLPSSTTESSHFLQTGRMYQILTLYDKPRPKGRGQGRMTHFQFQHPQSYLRTG